MMMMAINDDDVSNSPIYSQWTDDKLHLHVYEFYTKLQILSFTQISKLKIFFLQFLIEKSN